MKSIICGDMPELISLYLDDELDEVARTRVRRHTAQCAVCAPLFAELQAVDTLLKGAPMQAAPDGFTERAVTAAYQAAFHENLRIGIVTLLLGTVALFSLLFLGNAATLARITTMLVSPGAFMGMDQWGPSFIESLQVFWRVSLGALATIGDVLAAPLAVTLVAGLLSAYLLAEILKRTRVQVTA